VIDPGLSTTDKTYDFSLSSKLSSTLHSRPPPSHQFILPTLHLDKFEHSNRIPQYIRPTGLERLILIHIVYQLIYRSILPLSVSRSDLVWNETWLETI
jgi:hypothetical protein